MSAHVRVVSMYTKVAAGTAVDTTSRSGRWSGLSPFLLGPCPLWGGYEARNVENAWQFSKVYADQVGPDGDPSNAWWEWARRGWADTRPHRYPRGRGAVPLYSWWDGRRLGYVEARKAIYGPVYARAVQQTDSWVQLRELYRRLDLLVLRDYDGYDHEARGMSLSEVLNDPRRKMGHAFVLKMLLTEDPALQQFRGAVLGVTDVVG